MPKSKEQKGKIIENLKEEMSKQKAIFVVGVTGVNFKDLSELRKNLKLAGGQLQIVKKTLASKVLKENNIDFDKNKYKEEIAFVFGFKEEVMPAKAVYQFSRINDKLKILGGFLENNFKNPEEIIILAQLPSREELLAKLVRSISSPVSGLLNVLQGNIKGLVLALDAISKSK